MKPKELVLRYSGLSVEQMKELNALLGAFSPVPAPSVKAWPVLPKDKECFADLDARFDVEIALPSEAFSMAAQWLSSMGVG